MTTYPTRQPITTANIEAALAAAIAKRFPNGEVPRIARLNLRVKHYTPAGHAAIVEQMSEDMRMFGDGMTEDDLRLAGYSEDQIKHCARQAKNRAMQQSRLN